MFALYLFLICVARPLAFGLSISGNLTSLEVFIDSQWAAFNLTQTQIINCFNEATASQFFSYLEIFYNYTQAFTSGNQQKSSKLLGELKIIEYSITSSLTCAYSTQDYEDYIEAANVTANLTTFLELQSLYYKAYMHDWLELWSPIYNYLETSNFEKAGTLQSQLFLLIVQNATIDNYYLLQVRNFDNYLYFSFNLTNPEVCFTCETEQNATYFMTFMYLWSQTVDQSNLGDVVNNTMNFLNGEGGQLISDFQSLLICEEATSDLERINDALGYDINSSEFQNLTVDFIQNNPLIYLETFKEIYQSFLRNSPGEVGFIYGKFAMVVAEYSKSY